MSNNVRYGWLFILLLAGLKALPQADSSRFRMVRALSHYIKTHYVSAELAQEMCDSINWKLYNGGYDSALNTDEFAFELTKDLRRISNDPHISITRPQFQPMDALATNISQFSVLTIKQREIEFRRKQKEWERLRNAANNRMNKDMFSYGEIKILPGNIGYVEIKDFNSTTFSKKLNRHRIKIEQVMGLLKRTDALIVDLRNNQGGSLRQAAKFCSFFSPTSDNYFLTAEWHYRYDSAGIEKEYSYAYPIRTSDRIDNSFIKGKPVYILVSHWTFSAAELAVYKIRQYDPLAVVVGEKTTGGGNGHLGGHNERYFFAVIPEFRFFDENNANYSLEGKGITPDISVSEEGAMPLAYRLATTGKKIKDSQTIYFKREARLLVETDSSVKKFYPEYIGDYRKIRILSEGSTLFMLYDTYYKSALLPLSKDHFVGKYFEPVTFLRDDYGHVNGISIRHTEEFSEFFYKQQAIAASKGSPDR